jgi:hypothetical protein
MILYINSLYSYLYYYSACQYYEYYIDSTILRHTIATFYRAFPALSIVFLLYYCRILLQYYYYRIL